MAWNKNPSFTDHVGSITELAAKNYLLKNGVWELDEHGNRKLPFDGRLPAINAFDVDGMKNSATSTHEKFRTCDALIFPSNDGAPCLIEFKDQPQSNINEPELMDKGWGSLVVLHKTLLKSYEFRELVNKIRLIVVFSSSKGKITQFLAGKAGASRDSFNIPICWDLDYFQQVGIFSSVHTWDDAQFGSYWSAIGLEADEG